MTIYKGYVPVSPDIDSAIDISITSNDSTKAKSAKTKFTIRYMNCKSRICPHKEARTCPFPIGSLGFFSSNPQCPNGVIKSLDQPNRGTKIYAEFVDKLTRVQFRNAFGEYSKYVYDNKDREMTIEEYEELKDKPGFNSNRISSHYHSRSEVLENVQKEGKFSSYTKKALLEHRHPFFHKFFCSFRSFMVQEIEASLTKDMGMWLSSEEEMEIYKWSKSKGPLFILGGEYVIVKIPHLYNFDLYGLEDVFVYSEEKKFGSMRHYNAVSVWDFEKIYNYLISFSPMDFSKEDIKEYKTRYVPCIKKQYPSMKIEVDNVISKLASLGINSV